MATLFLLIFILLSIFFVFIRYRKTAIAMLSITFIYFVLVANGIIPAQLLKQLQLGFVTPAHPHWQKRNAIVLLGAGTIKLPEKDKYNEDIVQPSILAYSRINETVRLYLDCRKSGHVCTILISGGDTHHSGHSEAAVYQKILYTLGIDRAHIILEPNSLNTYKNAEFSSTLLKQQHFDQIILVTSGIHMRRTLLYFSYFGIHAQPAPSDYIASTYSMLPSGYNFVMTDFAIHEYLGLVRLYIYNFLGWNN